MGSPLPPDPYLALGVAKDATAGAIKTQYRKLVLKFHPDKVQDESQKQAAADQFHRIQTAYEIVGDEDRRQRYDAQCKLAELRRDVMERQGGGGRGQDVRTAAYNVPTEGPRGAQYQTRGPERPERMSPTYEERRPAYAPTDYFDTQPPRPATRKSSDYDRETKRKPPREERERTRSYNKEAERATRKEKSKKADANVRRDRDRKQTYVEDDSSDDDDSLMRRAKQMGDDDVRRARDEFHEQVRKQRDDAMQGFYDNDLRARKTMSQWDGAAEYISRSQQQRRPESERRPSPTRKESARDTKVEHIRRADGQRPAQVRRGSARTTKTSGRDAEPRDSGRRPSAEIVDEPYDRRPPTLNQTRSSPADLHMPYDKPRAQSVQIETEEKEDFIPKMRRAETMPHASLRERSRKDGVPLKGSSLRQTEFADGLATPGATPEYNEAASQKYHYGQQQRYADDGELATPEGFRIQVVEPLSGAAAARPRFTRSPSPARDPRDPRDSGRTASAGYGATSAQRDRAQAPPHPRTTSRSYSYAQSQGAEQSRPAPIRENSGRGESLLYGEVQTSTSPRPKQSKYTPPPESVHRQREPRPEDIKVQSGAHGYTYKSSRDHGRPSISRQASGKPIHVR